MKLLKQLIDFFRNNKNSEKAEEKENSKKKFLPVFFLLIVGLIILVFPTQNSKKGLGKENTAYELDIISYRENEERRLSDIFSDIVGVEKAQVIITYSDNGYIEVLNEEKTVMKKNENISSVSEFETEKNPVYNNDKNTVVKKRHSPTISGVCIFYKGDDNKTTRDRLFRAAKGALGTESHKIEIVLTK